MRREEDSALIVTTVYSPIIARPIVEDGHFAHTIKRLAFIF